MRAAILRAPPGAGKASSHATTRADPCRELPAPDVDNLSLTLITSRDQSEQKPETRTQSPSADPVPFRGSHLKKIGWGFTCSLAGMSSLGRSGRCIHTAETRPTGRSHGKSRRVSQKTDPRKNRARGRNRPTPGFSAMGNRDGKPQQKPYGKPRSGVCFIQEWHYRTLGRSYTPGSGGAVGECEAAEGSVVTRRKRGASTADKPTSILRVCWPK